MDSINQKDTETKGQSIQAGFVSDNHALSFVHRKLEKLVSALYKVTDFMDSAEPIRTKLRASGTDLISYLSRTYAEGEREKRSALRYGLNELSAIVSLCEIARSTGVVSEMNFTILKEEFIALINFIEQNFRGLTSSQTIADLVRLEFNENKEFKQVKGYPVEPSKPLVEIGRVNIQKDILHTKKVVSRSIGQSSGDSNGRHEKIMSFIRKHGTSSIKDITSVISDCSEKTVQRDLVSLVGEGLLLKKGERRWSTYVLNQ